MQLTIISGASSGIGDALAERATADGHRVATISRRPGPGEYLEADLSDPASWPGVSAWMDQLVQSEPWDRIVFVHNAGVIDPIGFAGETDPTAYTSAMLLNGTSPVVLGSAFIASASQADVPAHLLLISSGAARRPFKGWSGYCAGKAATDMWAWAAGEEQDHRGSKITVTSVAPGVVDTDMQAAIRTQDGESFPDIDNFHQLKESGSLLSADDVAASLLDFAGANAGEVFRGLTVANGARLHIGDFGAA